ncbi:MAG: hypothetical protein Q8R13_03085 [bacterium]|nr:hypothetical protein [bacterium]
MLVQVPSIQEVEWVFFDAMVHGWAAGAEKIPIPHMPGAKGVAYQRGDWYVLDHYRTTPYSGKSSGEIDIWYQDNLVWAMQFRGEYEEQAIPLLKEALRDSYFLRRFVGGRGPVSFRRARFGTLVYINDYDSRRNSFTDFRGREMIVDDLTGAELGWHEYRGMSMV